MYLKSIEIQGFKSFANRILFEFHNGVTGIVGPNGSGKSNVADAMRWVLGEQSAKSLRGGSMQDVIFAGTEMRRPQGFAYVAITLDNTDHVLPIDFDEVTVSRRLYRSGESEYKINGSACRLKDINELFYDTGIGKEGYSIIGQGQIERILSGRPEERRELFDEAAGIVKFKRRKAEAQKKLDDEQQNLVRINDILAELEHRVGPLKIQAEKAKEYLELRDSLKRLDINLFLLETKSLREQLTESLDRAKIVQNDLDTVRRESEEKKGAHEQLTILVDELDAAIRGADEAAAAAELEIQTLTGKKGVLGEKINSEKAGAEHVNERLQAIGEDIARKEDQKKTAEEQIEEWMKKAEEAREKGKDSAGILTEKRREAAEKEAEIGRIRDAIMASLEKKSGIAADIEKYRTQYEETDARRAELVGNQMRLESDMTAGDEEIDAKKAELARKDASLTSLRTESEKIRERIAQEEQAIASANDALSAAQRNYHIAQTRLESLRNLAERYEGYGNSIRRVMEQKARIPGIKGVVADLISTDKRYETAIETALGGTIQNIVTDNEETAKRLISFLKQNRAGRATFLPETSMKGRGEFPQKSALSEEGVLGLASDLVKTAQEFRGIMDYLLGRTVVADTIDHAIALNRKYHYALRIVTLEGELLNAGGSLTGGAFKNSSNLLGRKREMDELEEQKDRALEEVEKNQSEILRIEEKHMSDQRLRSENNDAIQKALLDRGQVEMELQQAERRRDESRENADSLSAQIEQAKNRMTELKAQRSQAEEDLERIENDNADMAERSSDLTDELEELHAEMAEAEEAQANVSLEVEGFRQKSGFARETKERLEQEIRGLEEEKEELCERNNGREDRIREREEEIRRIDCQIEEETGKRDAEKQKAEQTRARRAEEAAKSRAYFDEQEKLTERMNLLDRDLVRLDNQKEKLEEKIEGRAEYIRSEYELEYAGAEQFRDESLDSVPDMKRDTAELRNRIKGLGQVSVNAIDEYREVSERYEFMEKQHADLEASEAALRRIIEELDQGMKRQFTEKFQEIAREFNSVFRELFGGGSAALKLDEGVDVLEAGIGIISQPPGKKLQNMMQLSGGEKALTAIALLFAIQNLKPSPFCLLDEIEAALDDSNVDRFAGYLHKLTEHTQFIVITHRRGTMLGCDRLYGITMQEKGVSTMVSVSLIESDLEGGK